MVRFLQWVLRATAARVWVLAVGVGLRVVSKCFIKASREILFQSQIRML
jgi:hypothetical protein